VTGAPVAIIYGASMAFAVGAFLLVAGHLLRLLAGRLGDDELITIQESEEAATLAQVLPPQAARRNTP
jgi:TRAP-type C4-dicarboxylate transport system permease small subunit